MNESCRNWVQNQLPHLEYTPKQPDVFVLGFHTEFKYKELADLCLAVQKAPQTPLIATHPDKVCPWQGGYIPDVGIWIDVLAQTTGRKPDLVLGKPDPTMAAVALERYAPSELLMFGDRLYTDYELCVRSGIDFCLMLTGESNLESIKSHGPNAFYILPEFTHIQTCIGLS
jgi:ribonucleotide monophosphatase NagD (HAD superfamily)